MMKLTIAQMAFGVLILCPYALRALGSVSGGFAISYPRFIIPLLGLAVLGCGIAQYLKARRYASQRLREE